MNLLQLLTELATQQIALTVTRDCISTNKPVDQIPGHLVDVLRLNKQTLISLFFTPLNTGDSQRDLLNLALSLGGKVVDVHSNEVEPDQWLTDTSTGIITPGDEIPF